MAMKWVGNVANMRSSSSEGVTRELAVQKLSSRHAWKWCHDKSDTRMTDEWRGTLGK